MAPTKQRRMTKKTSSEVSSVAPSSVAPSSVAPSSVDAPPAPVDAVPMATEPASDAMAAAPVKVKRAYKRRTKDANSAEGEITSGKIRKKHVRRVPKTPSSYLLFSVQHRKTLISVEPNLSLGDVSKRCGEAWRGLDQPDKDLWKKKADELKAEAMENAPPPKPKKPPSSYLLFAMDRRKDIVANNPNLTLAEVSKMCGVEWKKLSDSDRDSWRAKAEALKTPSVA